jgi:hypothetical protein
MARARKPGEKDAGDGPDETVEEENGTEAPDAFGLLEFLNQPISAGALAAALELGDDPAVREELEAVVARREKAGGMLESISSVAEVLGASRRAELALALGRLSPGLEPIAPERAQFKTLLLKNPNYFGNLAVSPFKPVQPLQGDTTYEQLVCVGLDPPFDRLEGVIQVRKTSGYGGGICTLGTREYVRFFVDLYDNGVWHDVGVASVRVHDIPGPKPLCYAIRRYFSSYKKFCTFENVVKVRAVLQWNVPPPSDPTYVPVWGNVMNVQVQIQTQKFFFFGDLIDQLVQIPLPIPDPIGPVIEQLDPKAVLPVVDPQPLSLLQKKELYADKGVPAHRFAFQEASQLLALSDPNVFAQSGKSTLADLGLELAELDDLVGKLVLPVDGDTSYEELKCVGLYPESDLLEAVFTVKKSSGYSGTLCGGGSTEYVAFWADFGDGSGFQYMGTSTVNVHDLQTIPGEGVQYAVLLPKDLSKYRVPCQAGARVVRLRAILSWEAPPPPGNPNWVPVWGNRRECRVQIRPGALVGHIPLIETVGDLSVPEINPATGLATGDGEIGNFTVLNSPFGGVVTITGEIGDPPESYAGGPPDSVTGGFKYRIEVFGPPPFDSWQPLVNPIYIDVATWSFGFPNSCPMQPGVYECQVKLTPTDDGDGLGAGWYPYLEDTKGVHTRHRVVDVLARWQTNVAMEGLWQIRMTAKDPNGPVVYAGIQTVTVRVDNTPPSGPAGPGATQQQIEANPPLEITGATFEGNAIPATDCGKFPVGTILSGTYEIHDPGLTSPNQHFGGLTLDVIPDGPANGAAPNPSSRSYPIVSTNGEAGTWTLDTAVMDPCGYVIRLHATDRTNVDSRGNPYELNYDVGFCLVAEGE